MAGTSKTALQRGRDISAYSIQGATYADGTFTLVGSAVSIKGFLKGDQGTLERQMEEASSDCTEWMHEVQVAKGHRMSIQVMQCSAYADLQTIMNGEFAKITKTGIGLMGSGLYYSVGNVEEGGQGKGIENATLHFGPADNGD